MSPGLQTGACGLRDEQALVHEAEQQQPHEARHPPGRPGGQEVDLQPRVDHPEVPVHGHGREEGDAHPSAEDLQEEQGLAGRVYRAPRLASQVEGGVEGQAEGQQEVGHDQVEQVDGVGLPHLEAEEEGPQRHSVAQKAQPALQQEQRGHGHLHRDAGRRAVGGGHVAHPAAGLRSTVAEHRAGLRETLPPTKRKKLAFSCHRIEEFCIFSVRKVLNQHQDKVKSKLKFVWGKNPCSFILFRFALKRGTRVSLHIIWHFAGATTSRMSG